MPRGEVFVSAKLLCCVACDVVELRNGGFIESGIPGNCQAYGQSSAAVVMPGATQSDELSGDGIYAWHPHNRGGKRVERSTQLLIHT